MKSRNESCSTCEPIMMFGGSPISVAVPPMFEAITWTSTSGTTGMLEQTRQLQADRHHEQDRRQVVEERGEDARHEGEQDDEPEGTPAREPRDVQREIGEDSSRLREPDDDHHPDQQPERRPVDRLDRGLDVERANDARRCAAPTSATFVRWPNSSAIASKATAKADAATTATTIPPSCGQISKEAERSGCLSQVPHGNGGATPSTTSVRRRALLLNSRRLQRRSGTDASPHRSTAQRPRGTVDAWRSLPDHDRWTSSTGWSTI